MKKPHKKSNVPGSELYQVGKQLPAANRRHKISADKKIDPPKKKRSKKRIASYVLLAFIVLFSAFGLLLWHKAGGIFNGNLVDLFAQNKPLAEDSFGRTNILVFGTSEDDEGHAGATLADSIMVISVDQDTYQANMLSIPRDLWVKFNSKCSLGSEGKINAAYYCALEENKKDEDKASAAFARQASSIIGTEVQYYAKVNYTVVKDVVNSLGGIDVTIASTDSRGIYDVATKVKLSNGTHHIDGDTALLLSRARGSAGGYGLERSNFDRERNQQLIASAILSKASSSGTLVNPIKVLSVFGSLGNNITSNIETAQIKTVVNIAQNVQPGNVVSLPLDDKEKPLVKTGTYNSTSIVRPVKGIFDYSEIQAYVKEAFTPKTNTESN